MKNEDILQIVENYGLFKKQKNINFHQIEDDSIIEKIKKIIFFIELRADINNQIEDIFKDFYEQKYFKSYSKAITNNLYQFSETMREFIEDTLSEFIV